MPIIDGVKYACEPCMRGHRSSKCNHSDRILIKVRKPGRPLSSCPHEAGSCTCEVASVAIPKISANCPCGSPSGVTKNKKEDKGGKLDRGRTSSHTSSIPGTPSQHRPPIGYGYTGIPTAYIDQAELISPTDGHHMWQQNGVNNGIPNAIPGGLHNGVINGVSQMGHAIDLNTARVSPYFNGEIPPNMQVPMVKPPAKKGMSCCKPENGQMSPAAIDTKGFMDNTVNMFPWLQSSPLASNSQYGDFSKDNRSRRHTAEIFNRKRASFDQFPMSIAENGISVSHGYDRSMSVPNVQAMPSGMMNNNPYPNGPLVAVPEDSTNQYQIFTAKDGFQRYNQQEMLYMAAIKEAHQRQQQEEAETMRRASEAGEHAHRLNESCCAPVADMNDKMGYALPHGQECGCGPSCSCIMCASHPYNQATIDYIKNMHSQMQNSELSSGEHSPSTSQGFAHSVAASNDFSGNGSLGIFGDGTFDAATESGMAHPFSSEDLSPSGYIRVDYPLGGGSCTMQNGACMCGDGCTCVGCLTHGGHNGEPLQMDATILQHPINTEAQSDGSRAFNGSHDDAMDTLQELEGANSPHKSWKTEEVTTPSGLHA